MKLRHQDTVRKRFFAPAMKAIREAKSCLYCVEYPDENFIAAGVGRVLASAPSGRDWVQRVCSDWAGDGLGRGRSSTFQVVENERSCAW